MKKISSLLLTMPIILGSIATIPHTKVSAEPMSFNQETFTLETLNQQTDQAIVNGNFEAHLTTLTAYLNGDIGGMTEENLKKKLADPVFAAALAQWQFISQTGAAVMGTFAKKDADHQKFLSWSMKNTDVMNTYLEGGSPTGKNPVNALEIWNTIWNTDANSHEGLYLKLAIATSLAHAEPIKYWSNNKPINPLTRYQHYKSADQNNELLPCFRTYDVWHLRLVVNAWSPEEDLIWARNMINKEHPELKRQDKIGESAYLIKYTTHNKDGVSIHAGNDVFYGLGWNLSSIFRFGGVCGNISKFGTQVSQAFGVAAMPVGQPGHCALIWNNKPSSWNLGYDISGWSESNRHDETVIPWSDNSPTNQVPYMRLFENAEHDPVKLEQSERLRWLAKAMTSTDNKITIYKTATNILPINFLVWEDFVSLMLKNQNVTDNEWQELSNSIISAFANEQRPMMDLLTQIKSRVPNIRVPNILEGNQFSWSLKGISDFEFGKLDLNKSTEEMKIQLKAGVPHYYFNETYASIKVQKPSGKVVYNKGIYGNKQQKAETQTVPVKIGDYIELTHLEGVHRATFANIDNSKQESFGKKAMYEVTKEGLKKVEKMPEATILDGDQFAWSLKGYSDREFATADYNKATEKIQIKLEAGIPHSYFNETYASIKVQKPSGKVVYNKEIYGNKQQKAETQTVPVKVGDYIELTHLEGVHRAILANVDTNKQESFGKKGTYEVTKEGLKKVEKMPEPTILDGNQFVWSMKGIGDFEFATINLNKVTEEMQIDLKAGVPHNYFDSTYASIKVQNSSRQVVYNKNIYGNKQQTMESKKVPLKVGDKIELTHLEGVHRATMTNIDNGKQESFGKRVVYEVTSLGLYKVE
ncbi:putative mucin/carbohydrate-binding domain-containing protein [Bacillus wiedmannii]|uniref:putative mucin/carbohydrate-binding domain-containing protein n=1 Tax=Bacillus wiedmannii TaxID=1890302 RepID=UPI000B42FD51|nr:putative mucin/carbohydrate-binding domain-containing protein [Bacillus wiedmannii]